MSPEAILKKNLLAYTDFITVYRNTEEAHDALSALVDFEAVEVSGDRNASPHLILDIDEDTEALSVRYGDETEFLTEIGIAV